VPFGSPLPENQADAQHLAAVAAGRTFVSNVIRRDDVDRHVVYVVVPVMEAGRLRYTLRLSMPTAAFANTLHAERFSPGTVVTVMDRTGTIVMRDPSG